MPDIKYIEDLINQINYKIEHLQNIIEVKEKEIAILKQQNSALKDNYNQTILEIAKYVAQLEQIKKSLCL